MKLSKQYKIGDVIAFEKYYSTKGAGGRFKWNPKIEKFELIRIECLYACLGIVVGFRSVIMEDYAMHPGTYPEDHYDPGYVTGKRESVIMVVPSPWRKPFYVRQKDVL